MTKDELLRKWQEIANGNEVELNYLDLNYIKDKAKVAQQQQLLECIADLQKLNTKQKQETHLLQ